MFAGALCFVNAVTFAYTAFVPHCGKCKGGSRKAFKIDPTIFFVCVCFKMGKKIIKKSRFSRFIHMERSTGQGNATYHKDFKTACSDVPSKLCCLHCLRADVTVLNEV